MKNIYLFLCLAFFYPFFSNAQTDIPNVISSDMTWKASSGPYLLKQNAQIKKGATVTIEPGTVVFSTDPSLKLFVDGGLIAKGTKDSTIVFDETQIEYSETAVPYNESTGAGSQFRHCLFTATKGQTSTAVRTNSIAMLVDSCEFSDVYQPMATRSPIDTVNIYLKSTIFRCKTGKNCSGVNIGSSPGTLIVDNCVFKNLSTFYIDRKSDISHSTFHGVRRIQTTTIKTLNLECNVFDSFPQGVLDLSYRTGNADIVITNNHFNSAEFFLKLRVDKYYAPNSLVVNHNNFVNYRAHSINLTGGTSPGSIDTFDFTNNFWGTSDSASIAGGLTDYDDDITIAARINFSGYRSSPVKTCLSGGALGGQDTTGWQTAGIKRVPFSGQPFSIYPNPARNVLNIQGKLVPSQIRIIDLTGKEVARFFDSRQIELNDIENGLYIVVLEDNSNNYRVQEKLLINR